MSLSINITYTYNGRKKAAFQENAVRVGNKLIGEAINYVKIFKKPPVQGMGFCSDMHEATLINWIFGDGGTLYLFLESENYNYKKGDTRTIKATSIIEV